MSHKLPHSGIPVAPEYLEMVREVFPDLPIAAITQYWRHNASIGEIRTHLEHISIKEPA